MEPSFTAVLALSTQVFSWAPKFLCLPVNALRLGMAWVSRLLLSIPNNSTPDIGGLACEPVPCPGCSLS